MTGLKETYDSLSDSYTKEEHSTTRLFSQIQWQEIREVIYEHFRDKNIKQKKILNVGSGNGKHIDSLSNEAYERFYVQTINPKNVIDLDISKNMLESARKKYDENNSPIQIQGDVHKIPLKNESVDMVLATLCDHFEQYKFLKEANRVLKEEGIIVVSYPHIKLNKYIRNKIYNIPEDTTRFIVDGKNNIIPSKLMDKKNIQTILKQHNFSRVYIKEIIFNPLSPMHQRLLSETLNYALKEKKYKFKEYPLLIVGAGVKNVQT